MKRRTSAMLGAAIAAWLCAAPATAAVSCADWNTEKFFKRASAADVPRCLKAGANVDARNEDGLTPLHKAAASSKTPAVVDALLKAGANVNARDRAGKMPFDYVKENSALRGTDAYWRLNEARFK